MNRYIALYVYTYIAHSRPQARLPQSSSQDQFNQQLRKPAALPPYNKQYTQNQLIT